MCLQLAPLSLSTVPGYVTTVNVMMSRFKTYGYDTTVAHGQKSNNKNTRLLIWPITTVAHCSAARVQSTDVPREQYPCRSGGDTCDNPPVAVACETRDRDPPTYNGNTL